MRGQGVTPRRELMRGQGVTPRRELTDGHGVLPGVSRRSRSRAADESRNVQMAASPPWLVKTPPVAHKVSPLRDMTMSLTPLPSGGWKEAADTLPRPETCRTSPVPTRLSGVAVTSTLPCGPAASRPAHACIRVAILCQDLPSQCVSTRRPPDLPVESPAIQTSWLDIARMSCARMPCSAPWVATGRHDVPLNRTTESTARPRAIAQMSWRDSDEPRRIVRATPRTVVQDWPS